MKDFVRTEGRQRARERYLMRLMVGSRSLKGTVKTKGFVVRTRGSQ